eukprot:3307048-Prymnesium_polylepis.2
MILIVSHPPTWGYVPACPDGAPCLPACPVVSKNFRQFSERCPGAPPSPSQAKTWCEYVTTARQRGPKVLVALRPHGCVHHEAPRI